MQLLRRTVLDIFSAGQSTAFNIEHNWMTTIPRILYREAGWRSMFGDQMSGEQDESAERRASITSSEDDGCHICQYQQECILFTIDMFGGSFVLHWSLDIDREYMHKYMMCTDCVYGFIHPYTHWVHWKEQIDWTCFRRIVGYLRRTYNKQRGGSSFDTALTMLRS